MMWAGSIMCLIIFIIKPEDHMTLTLGISLVLVVLVTSTFEIY
jgi:hypothetical protein